MTNKLFTPADPILAFAKSHAKSPHLNFPAFSKYKSLLSLTWSSQNALVPIASCPTMYDNDIAAGESVNRLDRRVPAKPPPTYARSEEHTFFIYNIFFSSTSLLYVSIFSATIPLFHFPEY